MNTWKEQLLRESGSSLEELHHAYLIPGPFKEIVPELVSLLKKERGETGILVRDHDTFGINDSRELIERAVKRPVGGAEQFFVVGASRMTGEAQNALLKLFEEPNPGTHFFLIVPSASLLVSTLRSRCAILNEQRKEGAAGVREFLEAPIAGRSAIIETMVKTKDAAAARSFLNDLEAALHSHAHACGRLEEFHPALSGIEACRVHLAGRSPSVKMILEYVVATVPRIA